MSRSPVAIVRAESARFRHPLLLVHGLWTGAWIWRGFAAYVAHRGWDSWAPTLLDDPETADATARLDRLRDVVRDLDEPPIVVTHDAGLVTAARLGADAEFPAVVALNPVLSPVDVGEPQCFRWPQFWYARWFGERVAPPAGSMARRLVAGTGVSSEWRADSAAFFRDVATSRSALLPESFAAAGLIVASTGDPMLSSAGAADLARRRGWSYEASDAPGHFPMLQPGWEGLADRIHRWIVRTLGEDLLLFLDRESDASD